jgi:pimeloyl-ACP methyl ester carboxylesterase
MDRCGTSVIIDGIRSPLLEFGPANSDEAVVFVHGNPGSIRDWGALARSVGEFGRAVAIDMPGFVKRQEAGQIKSSDSLGDLRSV